MVWGFRVWGGVESNSDVRNARDCGWLGYGIGNFGPHKVKTGGGNAVLSGARNKGIIYGRGKI